MATIHIGPKNLIESIKTQVEVADNSIVLLRNRILEMEHELANQIPQLIEVSKIVEVTKEVPVEVIKTIEVIKEIPFEVIREVKVVEEKLVDVIKEIEKEVAVLPLWAICVMVIQCLLIILLVIF